MKIKSRAYKIEELLTRGVSEIIHKDHLAKTLKSKKRLRVKFGIDPTAVDLHLGHSVPLRKLRQFQDLGHHVIFLIGDFTAQIGDPSGRADRREPLTKKQIQRNMANYIQQAAKILHSNKVEVRYNSEWYEKKGVAFLLELTSHFTYARVIERDDFKRRLKKDIDIGMVELLYPLLQGYDSVALEADVEIGGTDQKFNLLMGRKVQKKYGQPQQDILTVPLLEGTDGVRKMSKSYHNYIGLTESSANMYGKVMAIPDALIEKYFRLLTDVPSGEIEKMRDKKIPPRDTKARLAREIVALYHSEKVALGAEKEFERIFKEKQMPSKIPTVRLKKKSLALVDLLVAATLASSKSEARRLVAQKGVKIDGVVQDDWQKKITVKTGMVVQVGKRRFVRLRSSV